MAFETFGRGGASTFGQPAFATFGVEPDRGIIGSVIHELGLDALGTARVVGATAGELAGLMGISVPLTYEDLTTRDLKGAMMVAALGVGGVAGGAVRAGLGLPATFAGRAGATALSEAAAGAAFGLVAPLEEDDTRLKSIVGNAAYGGALGAGASMMKSAVKATLAGRAGTVRAAAARSAMQTSLLHTEQEMVAREMAGVQLLNPETGERMGIRRTDDGLRVLTTIYNPGAGRDLTGKFTNKIQDRVAAITVESPVTDFGTAFAEATRAGFTDALGPWDAKRALGGVAGILDQKTLDLIAREGGDITSAIGMAEMNKYRAVREAAAFSQQARDELTSLVGEIAAPHTWLGEPKLPESVRIGLVREMGLAGKQMADASDSEVLRESIRRGLVDVTNLGDGMSHAAFAEELVLNDYVGAVDTQVAKRQDAFLTSVLLPTRIAKWFPEIAPVVAAGDIASQAIETALMPKLQWLHELRSKVGTEEAVAGVRIIDDSLRINIDMVTGMPATDWAATRALAEANAAAAPAGVAEFVRQTMPLLEEYATKLQGATKKPLAGLIPTFNANRWQLHFDNVKGVEWMRFHDTEDAARRELARVRALEPNARGFLAPRSFTWSRDSLIYVDDISVKQATARAKMTQASTARFAPGQDPNTASSIQSVSLADFADDPFEALSIYIYNAERVSGLAGFEALAKPLVDALPESQSNLKAWGRQYIADMLGQPRDSEVWFDHLLERMGIDAKPRALRRYVTGLRRWETSARLGGFWSGAVNLTQTTTNTYAVLGAKYTARGLGGLVSPSKTLKELEGAGVDMGIFMPFTEANLGRGDTVFDTFAGAMKERRYVQAAERIALAAFNSSERFNRLVVAWGAYQKALDDGLVGKAAGRVAQEVMERTQFNYRTSNMPELLRGPVGGLLLQFKSFLVNEIDFIASLSPKEAARFGQGIAMTGGLAAVFNMPGPDMLNLASLGWSQEKLSEKLATAPGAAAARGENIEAAAWRTVAFGLPGTLHVNLSDHIGLGTTAEITSGIFGPAVKDMLAFAKFVKDGALDVASSGRVSDDTKRALSVAVMPSALRRLKRGVEIASTGDVRATYTSKLLYRPEARMREAMLTAFGAPTVQQTEQLAANEIVERMRLGYTRARSSFGRRVGLAVIDGDTQAFQQALADASAAGHAFSSQDVNGWVREMRKPAAQRRRERTPRPLRSEMQELYNLTGSPAPEL